MNKKGLAVAAAALLFGTGLTPVLPCVGSPAAMAEDLNKMFPIDFGSSPARDGQTRISGYVHNKTGHATGHMRLVISGLDAKGHVVSQVYRDIDDAIPTDGQAYFEAQVPSSPSYRVKVDHFEDFQAR